ncbi:hypothetical protein NIES2104_11920 [Leptolyngbya sp. NIES-2104]|nr:hypothetical protein NIES2104_11920 [Leptolyngbya sp. NIES-2104]
MPQLSQRFCLMNLHAGAIAHITCSPSRTTISLLKVKQNGAISSR